MSARRALVSVSDKTGLGPFAKALVELGFEIISTGGTRRFLVEQGVPVIDISAYTGFPEMMDGRVKTLHPKVHGGLLGRPDLAEDAAAMQEHGIQPFELVVVNLYPFEDTIAKSGVTVAEAIENIDIGGPSMVRSSAKNHAYVGVVTRPEQYERVLAELRKGPLTPRFRRELSAAAFEMTARYDRAIADYMAQLIATETTDEPASPFPASLSLNFVRKQELRYGENPHQQAAFYVESNPNSATLAAAEQLHGKELSYNNLLDLDAAFNVVREFTFVSPLSEGGAGGVAPAAVTIVKHNDPGVILGVFHATFAPAAVAIIKHNNPCGAAVGDSLSDAFAKALAGDPVSAFGGIIGCNRVVDLATVEQLCGPDRFVEAIIAPGYTDEAFTALTTRPKWKANVRLLRCVALNEPRPPALEYRRVTGGLLVQNLDEGVDPESEWKVVTNRTPTAAELSDLKFAWSISRFVKSNAILLAKGGSVVGVGAGQMSRVDSAQIAVTKAGERAVGAVVASDAFFPFRDGLDLLAKAGITAVIEPGGSRNDADVIAACNEQNIAMIFTGRRHFKH